VGLLRRVAVGIRSTRSIVRPLTLASAALRTCAAVSPVSSVSSARWRGSPAAPRFAAGAKELSPFESLLPPPEAAPAMAEPPRASAVIEATIKVMFLTLSVMAFVLLGDWADFPRTIAT
jgi:hypothetical protein